MTQARYRLTTRIAAGELAESFRAVRDDSLDVVVKLFQAGTADERYARELAEVARRLIPFEAPGVIQVIDIGFASGRLAVVRESVDGFNLGQVLSRLTAWGIIFPTPLALLVLSELLEIVRRAHAAGVVHGGITPGNVFLCSDGQPALCDFGALQALSVVPELKSRFVPVGRGSYRAQEIERGETATQQSDVFSLGAVTYQLLTLREVSPGRADSTAPKPPHPIHSQIDQRLYPILMKSMEAIPQLRYGSCADFADALQRYLSANQMSPGCQDLQKFLRDLFPDGVGVQSNEGPLPFAEPFSLEAIEGLAPLQKSAALDDEARRRTTPASSGFEAAWYASPDLTRDPARTAEPSSPQADALGEGGAEHDALAVETGPTTSSEHLASTLSSGADASTADVDRGRESTTASAEAGRRRATRRQLMGLALFLLILGLFAIALAIWRPGHSGTDRVDSSAAPEPRPRTGARLDTPGPSPLRQVPEAAASVPAPTLSTTSQPPQPEPPIEWDSPPRKGGGLLSVSTDVPAFVYVDGKRVRQPAPLKRYPVSVGVRKISVVAADTREQRDFILRFTRGQARKLEETFDRPSAQR